MNMKYVMKNLPVVVVESITENTYDQDGKMLAGVVVFKNIFGSKCVMTYDQFMEIYEEGVE